MSLKLQQLIQIYENIIDFVCKNAKDIDIINNFNVHYISPFQRAIIIQSEAYATALINTKKVEFNVKVFENEENYTTYFHLAAMSNNSKLLKLSNNSKLLINEYNINCLDSKGNSILMKASNSSTSKSWELGWKLGWKNRSEYGWGIRKKNNTTPDSKDENTNDKTKTENSAESKISSKQTTNSFIWPQYKYSNNQSSQWENKQIGKTNNYTTDKTKIENPSSFQKTSQLTQENPISFSFGHKNRFGNGWGIGKKTNTTPDLNDANNNDITNKTKTENSTESQISSEQTTKSFYFSQNKYSNNQLINSNNQSSHSQKESLEENNEVQINKKFKISPINFNELNDEYDDDFEHEFYYCDYHNEINHNLIAQQFNFLMQCNNIRESQFNVLMNLNMNVLKKSHKKSRKRH